MKEGKNVLCLAIATLAVLSMAAVAVASPILTTSNSSPIGGVDQLVIKTHPMTPTEAESVVYNASSAADDGQGTGLVAASSGDLRSMIGNVSVLDSVSSDGKSTDQVDLSAEPYFPPVADQGTQNSCTGWALTYYAYGYMVAREHGWTDAHLGNPQHLLSPSWTYNKVNWGADKGSMMDQNGYVLTTWGAATMATMPYNASDYTSWGGEAAFREAPLYRAGEVVHMQYAGDSTIQQIKELVAAGVPVTFGLRSENLVGSGSAFVDGNFVVSSSEYRTGPLDHAQTIVGYSENVSDDGDMGAFKVVNSYGTGFADRGYYWLTYKALEKMGETPDSDPYLTFVTARPDYTPTLLAVWRFSEAPSEDGSLVVGRDDAGTDQPHFQPSSGRFPEFMSLDISDLGAPGEGNASSYYLKIEGATHQGVVSSFTVESYADGYSPSPPTLSSAQAVVDPTDGTTLRTELSLPPPVIEQGTQLTDQLPSSPEPARSSVSLPVAAAVISLLLVALAAAWMWTRER